ncbi:envelope stress response membrane protein PspB [Pseudohongiella sp. SYSU M77423]|uniref:envelope stress response membrane protein PspB n=1 Tax=unclassified Pseudohongiella TaxID=2629611 RepID=UPI000C8A1A82|nr:MULTISPECIES: envelope stress response membrane protein PspB [unclassified Pseudohongiella]MAO41070.1 envelope stress response membrane protein PspB [Pseudohongiella sp.]MAY54493.1 envelope stress response membrane protein PspB [Gammaproteobacteria bacterium]MDH7943507.1 envelope stress response membrane protein PspB [Pseudohongiella sp. SYSU M77423]HBX37799.1 envelope stress response membrane protein PspB [Pseudohongiella sp.]|tara:strand:- start:439 stop:675 length:237 start_codon:yes stop_codon:yes gene_type:complete
MEFFEFVIALVSIGGTFVTIWVVLLYRRKEKQLPAAAQTYTLNELSKLADTMNQRIDTLEAILDAEVPGWREQHEQSK